jgi:ribosomal protein S18 acetylase RimI-like enzyme
VAIRLLQPQSEQTWQQARLLIEQYAATLDVDLCFQNLSNELEHLANEYAPPMGSFLLAEDLAAAQDNVYLGCVGLRQISDGVGEIKRLYTIPAARGRGAGRLLAEGIVAAARQIGYAKLLLDTLPSMREALSLYASLGFKSTSAYRFNPVPDAVFLELNLR